MIAKGEKEEIEKAKINVKEAACLLKNIEISESNFQTLTRIAERIKKEYQKQSNQKTQWFDKYEEIRIFAKGGYAIAKEKDGFFSIVDKTGSAIIETKFDEVIPDTKGVNYGCAKVKCGGKWNFFDIKKEKMLLDEWFDEIYDFENGHAKVVSYDSDEE